MTASYKPEVGLGENDTREIRVPVNMESGHMLPLIEPGELRDDIETFLRERCAYHVVE